MSGCLKYHLPLSGGASVLHGPVCTQHPPPIDPNLSPSPTELKGNAVHKNTGAQAMRVQHREEKSSKTFVDREGEHSLTH